MFEEMQQSVKWHVPGGCCKATFKTLFNIIAESKGCHRGMRTVCTALCFTAIDLFIDLFCVGDSYSVSMEIRAHLPFGNGSKCSDCSTSSLIE